MERITAEKDDKKDYRILLGRVRSRFSSQSEPLPSFAAPIGRGSRA